MAHHFEDLEKLEVFRKALGLPEGLGATGQYPRGKLNDQDQGEIKIAIAADPATQTVLIDFGKPVAMIGFTAEQASDLAEMLHEKAMKLRGIT